jgi:hypothetical protein
MGSSPLDPNPPRAKSLSAPMSGNWVNPASLRFAHVATCAERKERRLTQVSDMGARPNGPEAEESSQHDDDAAAAGIGSSAEGTECGHAPEVGVPVISNRGLVALGLQRLDHL